MIEETVGDSPVVYKPLVKTPKGVLISLVAGLDFRKDIGGTKELEYEEGKITYAPEGSAGIFTSRTLDEAKEMCVHNQAKSSGLHGNLVVHKAIALGERILGPVKWTPDCPRYPAILLKEKAWQDSMPAWQDVTDECHFVLSEGVSASEGFYYLSIRHLGYFVGSFGDVFRPAKIDNGYCVEFSRCASPDWNQYSNFRVMKKVR